MSKYKDLLSTVQKLHERIEALEKREYEREEEEVTRLLKIIKKDLPKLKYSFKDGMQMYTISYDIKGIKLSKYYYSLHDGTYYINGKVGKEVREYTSEYICKSINVAKRLFEYVDNYHNKYSIQNAEG